MLSRQPQQSSSLSLRRTSFRPIILFVISMVISMFLFSALLTALDERYRFASSSVKEWTSSLSSQALVHFIGFENPYFTQVLPKGSKMPAVSSLALKLITSVKPGDIRSLLGGELPGFEIYDSKILVAGAGTNYTNLAVESSPPVDLMKKQQKPSTSKQKQSHHENKQKANDNVKTPAKTTGGKKVVFLYDTHSTESYLPAIGKTNPNAAYSWKINVKDVSKKLAEDLDKRGIGTVVSNKNTQAILQKDGLSYPQSYQVSRQIVTAEMKNDPNLQLIFDIHRDSRSGSITTATINGKKYARIFFIVGKANPNYEKNAAMAEALHHLLQKQYYGLSRGVEAKGTDMGNGVYNQDLSSHSLLIEIGGVDNTMPEVYRTCNALANVISEYYWNLQHAEKVSGSAK